MALRNSQTKSEFMYDIPSPIYSLGVSSRVNTKNNTAEAKQERYAKRMAEWQHDRQPPSSYYDSSETCISSKKKIKTSAESVSDTQNSDEVVPSSMPDLGNSTEDENRRQRFSARLMNKSQQRSAQAGKANSEVAIHTLDRSIYENELEIEKIKEHRGKLIKEVKRIRDLVSQDDSTIRTYERANMQLKTQKENHRMHAFKLDHDP